MMKIDKIKDFTIREYNIRDFDKIQKLFKISFNKELTYDYWHWKCIENPMGKSTAFLMFDGDKLIGHYNVDASILNFQGILIPAVLSSHTMTHPNYRGLGIFPYLAELTYQKVIEKGIEIVYGFPNINSHRIFELKLDWIKFYRVPFIFKDILKYKIHSNNKNYSIIKINKFDNEIDNFYENIKSFPKICRKISKQILNWRFSRKSTKKYDKFIVKNSEKKEIIGYFVLKIYKNKKWGYSIDLIDFFIDQNNFKQKFQIFKLIEEFSIKIFKNKCSKFMIWMPNIEILNKLIKDFNYKYVNFDTFFGYRTFKDEPYFNKFKEINNWHLTMAHSDIF